MSFGYSAGELLGFAQLALKIVQNSRRACGEHHGLTREVKSLHSALKRLEREASEEESAETSTEPTNFKDLKGAIKGCVRVLKELDGILKKYSSLSERELSVKKLWSKVRFGNSEMQELSRYRAKISTYLGIITLHLNLSTGSEMRKIKLSIDGIAAKMASGHEGSLLTSYGDDDKAAWKELRRELHRDGFEDSFIRENRLSIMDYVRELGDKGAFDEAEPSVAIGGSVDDGISDVASETDDFKSVMSEWDDDEEPPHEEESQLSTEPQSDASTSVELSQMIERVAIPMEEVFLQSALARLRRAQEEGKQAVKLNQFELDALEKRRVALRDKEEADVQSALARIRRAQEEGKQEVELCQDELDALEKRRKRMGS
jgi:hypothetical protein